MAAGILKIDYVGNHTGGHRIGWRIAGSGSAYTIIEPPAMPACAGVCFHDIPVTLEPDSCETIIFEGYIQALCHAEESLLGRVAWSTSYVPDEDCYSALVTCNEADIVGPLNSSNGFTITDVGAGYDVPPNPAPAVTFSSGSATADAYIADNGVATVNNITDPTGPHTAGPHTYTGVTQSGSTGAGTGAIFDVETDAGGNVTAITVTNTPDLHTNVGSGYIIGETITLNGQVDGGFTLNAGVTCDVLTRYATGSLLEILLTANDTYNAVPTVVIDPPPGASPKTALATVNMNPCASFNITQCDAAGSIALQMELGQSAIMCADRTATPFPYAAIPSDYTQAHGGCCYDCYSHSFTTNSGSPTLYYLDPADDTWKTLALVVGPPQVRDIVAGAYYLSPADADVAVVVGAACP